VGTEERKLPKTIFLARAAIALLAFAAAFPQDAIDRVAPENANETRLNRLQPPSQVMDIIGAAPGMTIAEIGAGRGRYVVHLADRVGPTGKIYAEDIDEAALHHCAVRCRRSGFDNVETILGGFTDPKLPATTLDLIFVISSYHHFNDPVALMKNARPALKPTGRLAIAEWVRVPGGRGEGTTPETMKSQIEEAGFVLERIDKSLEDNRLYIYLFRPRASDGSPVLKGPSLGQTLPGMTPELFADVLRVHYDLHSFVEANRRLNGFSSSKEALPVAGQALAFVVNCAGLVFDLRENGGGFPEMIQFLSSCFFPGGTKLVTLVDRAGNIANDLRTLDQIPGVRFRESWPVCILTSRETASAAERFVEIFKKSGRAKIIGENTKGATHPAREIDIHRLFVVSIPFLRAGETENVEGKGIVPDIPTGAKQALEQAVDFIKKRPA
jgi:ubiquinone/menaquinone biosynthesis C-methylase UbiE